ncbi:MAG: sodium-dependent bicarbonate transport family permease [Phenylobacterium sp.]
MPDVLASAAALGVQNLLAPAILFFVLGLFGGFARSDLSLPAATSRTLSLFLMLCIGFKGGVEAAEAGLSEGFVRAGIAGLILSLSWPLVAYPVLRRLGGLERTTAAATAAAFGSVSVVTYAAGAEFLTSHGVPFSGYMTAVLAIMEAPAILTALLIARRAAEWTGASHSMGGILREVFLGGTALMLVGSFIIGLATGERGMARLDVFVNPVFQGALCLFLLDMGLAAARSLTDAGRPPVRVLALGIALPLAGAVAGYVASRLAGLAPGDSALLILLAASASYIAAPAAMRTALPEARPGVYLGLSLGVAFPFHLILGLPLYALAAGAL